MKRKTFLELGIDSLDCNSCKGSSCHNMVTSKADNEEYSVRIDIGEMNKKYIVNVCKGSNTSDCENEYIFESEGETVEFLDANYFNFKCF